MHIRTAGLEFHNDRRLTLQNGARMPILYPGEKITTVNAARPYSNFEVFESAVLRNFSPARGVISATTSIVG